LSRSEVEELTTNWRDNVKIFPQQEVVFREKSNEDGTTTLTGQLLIKNQCGAPIIYKVKSNDADSYNVMKSIGLIDAKQ